MTAMPKRTMRHLAILWLAVLAAAAGWTAWRQFRHRAELSAKLASLEIHNRDLRSHNDKLAQQNQMLRARLEALGEPPPALPASPSAAAAHASSLEQARLLAKMQSELAAAGAMRAELEARVHEAERGLAKALEENQRLAASQQELEERLAGEKRAREGVQAELKTKSERLTQLETTNLLLHRENREAAQKADQTRQLLREIEEVNRRRENLMAGILRRYREVTDQLRTLAVRPEGVPEGRAVHVDELSRLQNALAMTEEDLRQLGGLNSQAARLQRKISDR